VTVKTGRRAAALVGPAMVLAIVAAACIPARVTPAPASAAPSPNPTATLTAGPDATPSTEVAVDPSLLDLLPADIDGIAVTADPATAAEVAADDSLAPFIDGLAIATVFGPIATDAAVDYVVVTVARLRPGTFGDLFFRGWRDTFDEAVCAQAGGVDGHAEADIADHRTYIGTCAGGVRTHHVHLPASDVIVSMQSAGPGRFGERIVAGLTE
jgi:hypothetical protein